MRGAFSSGLLWALVFLIAAEESLGEKHEDYKDCFSTANCFGFKDGKGDACLKDGDCDQMVSLKMDGDDLDILWHARDASESESKLYMAVGMSDSKEPEATMTLACMEEEVILTWNKEDEDDWDNNFVEVLSAKDNDDYDDEHTYDRSDGVTTCKYTFEGVDDIKFDDDDNDEREFDLTTKEYYVLLFRGEQDDGKLEDPGDDQTYATNEKFDLSEVRDDPNDDGPVLPEEYKECFKTKNCFGIPDTASRGKCPEHCVLNGNCKMLVSVERVEDEDEYKVALSMKGLPEDDWMAVGLTKNNPAMESAYVVACTKDSVLAYWNSEGKGKHEANYLERLSTRDWTSEDGMVSCTVNLDAELDIELSDIDTDLEDLEWNLDDDEFYIIMAHGKQDEDKDEDEAGRLLKHDKDHAIREKFSFKEVVAKPKKCNGAGAVRATAGALLLLLAVTMFK